MKRPVIYSLFMLMILLGSTAEVSANQISPTASSKEPVKMNGLVPETATEYTKIELEDGMTKPIYPIDEAIIENLLVETETDSDGDGKRDRVAIRVMRPHTDPGIKVPVIYEMSPYRAGGNPVDFHNVDMDLVPIDGKPSAANLGSLGDYYVPRGYAVILGYSIGSGASDGCPTVGDVHEIMGTKAVIDWLNGRAKAFTEDGGEVNADWSTGHVGMIGVSYNGTLPNGVAATGVEGLKTIIPIAAISNWYDYYRANGAVVAPGGYQGEDADVLAKYVLTRKNPDICQQGIDQLTEKQDRITGDYNEFWNRRNYLNDANNIKASVLIVHGLNDWNVKTKQFSQWWEALKQNNIPRKMWLHQGGHSGVSSNNWKQTENRWFDYWLYGIENGLMDEPKVDIQREDRTWHQQEDWPAPEAASVKLHLKEGTDTDSGVLSSEAFANASSHESLTDTPLKKATELAAEPEIKSENRLAYLSPVLKEPIRLSGTPVVTLKASIDRRVANLTALLVDYGGTKPEIVTRGWMDPQNLESAAQSVPLTPHQAYTFKWDMQPDDYVFKSGHRLGIILLASDHEFTIRPPAGTKITIFPGESEITLPIDGELQHLNITAAIMEKTVQQFEKDGEFTNNEAARSLQVHLVSIHHFEQQGKAEKVVQHMKSFYPLLDHYFQKGHMSERAYQTLKSDTDYFIKKWQ
ncbi:X-Pro dipeptidyl-peptidase [Bacillus thermophilus]|uniref:X-Pro dipeptidyl-peptidase n=2 Tax=Bacillaceae TaxID=186817 RepID=A0ABS2R5K4_9BACI|nr:X-Pro dipeptidyl-peptidase [Siminovitchia thermophila]